MEEGCTIVLPGIQLKAHPLNSVSIPSQFCNRGFINRVCESRNDLIFCLLSDAQ